MHENVLCSIKNVVEAEKAVNYLQNRPKTELPGFAIMYGEPGISKTRMGERLAYEYGMIYIRMQASDTPKSFLLKIVKLINYKLKDEEREKESSFNRMTTNQLHMKVIEGLNKQPDLMIFIDEFDHAVKNHKLREVIRGIGDQTIASIVLLGMEKVYDKLKKENPYFFDRCIVNVRFREPDLEDVKIIFRETCEITIKDDLIEQTFDKIKHPDKSKPRYTEYVNFRKVVKYIYMFEQFAIKKGLTELSLADFEGEQK